MCKGKEDFYIINCTKGVPFNHKISFSLSLCIFLDRYCIIECLTPWQAVIGTAVPSNPTSDCSIRQEGMNKKVEL